MFILRFNKFKWSMVLRVSYFIPLAGFCFPRFSVFHYGGKYIKRDSVSVYVHMKHDIPLPLYAPVHILDSPLHSSSCTHT